MCWIPTNKERIAVAKVAQKDIPIIKIGKRINNAFISQVYHALYYINEPTQRIFVYPDIDGCIYKGYHFFKPNMVTMRLKYDMFGYVFINSRLRIRTPGYSRFYDGVYIAKGCVPRGTIYYLNAYGEGVAEKIVITEFINIKDYLTKPKLSKL